MAAAGNLLLFCLWLSASASVATLLLPGEIEKMPRIRSLDRFHLMTSLMMTLALVWCGHLVMAAWYLLGWCARRAMQKTTDSTKDEQ